MKKEVVVFALVAFGLSVATLFLLSFVQQPRFSPPETIVPTDCSPEALTVVWDNIFAQNSIPNENILRSSQNSAGGCTKYLVTHTVESSPGDVQARFLTSYEENGKVITIAMYVRTSVEEAFTPNNLNWFNELFSNYNAANNDKIVQDFYNTQERNRISSIGNVLTSTQASAKFTSLFDLDAGNWGPSSQVYFTSPLTGSSPQWRFIEESSLGGLELTGYVFRDLQIASATFVQEIPSSPPPPPEPCVPAWTAQNTTCIDGNKTQYWTETVCNSPIDPTHQNQTFACVVSECISNWIEKNTACGSDETYTIYHTDDNICETPVNYPANRTAHCDFDSNGIIGKIININEHNVDDLEIEIDEKKLNLSDTYRGTNEVEIFEDEKLRVKFKWDFDEAPLNLKEIELRKQTSSADYGYLIVNGLDIEKEIRIDRIAETDSVCVKEREISSISKISDDCDKSREELISCPGESDDEDVTCEIDGDFLVISGLKNSGVTEYDADYIPPTCTESWSYGAWSVCSNGQQTRTATDANDCGTTIGRQEIAQTCSTQPPPEICTPEWDCPDWNEIECPDSGTKTRTCTNSNSCGTNSNKQESRTCTQPKSNTTLIIILIIGILLALGAIVLVVALMKRRKRERMERERRRPTTSSKIITQQPNQRRQF